MRRGIIYIASIAAFFGALLVAAVGLNLCLNGSAGYGLAVLFLGTPCMLGLAIVFDRTGSSMEKEAQLEEEGIIDIDPAPKRTFSKYGGG